MKNIDYKGKVEFLDSFLKVSSVSHRRRCWGRVFQITGPAYENERSAALVFVRGICSTVLSFCERSMNFLSEYSYFLEIMAYPLFPLKCCYSLADRPRNSNHNKNKSLLCTTKSKLTNNIKQNGCD